MLFDSLDFAVFLPVVFLAYWLLNKGPLALQNAFLVMVSYVFYAWWDWRFLGLILLSTLTDYFVANQLSNQENATIRKWLLWLSLAVNLGLLCFFKYSNFFIDSFAEAFSFFGVPIQANQLNIILPVGISFYTLQTISYTVDVYRRKLKATNDFVVFAGYVSFFPQLVAGPIERAGHMLPQFFKKRQFDLSEFSQGLRQMLWGLFKKIVIANNAALFADQMFGDPSVQSGSNLLMGSAFFTVQLYADFSGYSDIAIGTARLFGFRLKTNFAYPFFSRNMVEFWRRWHVSLMTWLKDYVYIPLGGRQKRARNILIVFLLSGFWHGANLTFLFFGLFNGIFCVLTKRGTSKEIIKSADLKFVLNALLTNFLFLLTLVFFRSQTVRGAFIYFEGMFNGSLFTFPDFEGMHRAISIGLLTLGMLWVEWKGRFDDYGIAHWTRIKIDSLRWFLYLLLVILMALYSIGESREFVYFQF